MSIVDCTNQIAVLIAPEVMVVLLCAMGNADGTIRLINVLTEVITKNFTLNCTINLNNNTVKK